MVRAGTPVTFQVQGQTNSWLPPDASGLRSQVIAFLSANFFVTAVEVTIRSVTGRVMAGEFWNYDYSALVTVVPRSDYASPNDVGSVVAHAFYLAGGGLPTVSTDLRSTGTGGISEEASDPTGLGGTLNRIGESLANLPTLLVGGIIIIVAIIVFSPAGRAAGRSGIHLT